MCQYDLYYCRFNIPVLFLYIPLIEIDRIFISCFEKSFNLKLINLSKNLMLSVLHTSIPSQYWNQAPFLWPTKKEDLQMWILLNSFFNYVPSCVIVVNHQLRNWNREYIYFPQFFPIYRDININIIVSSGWPTHAYPHIHTLFKMLT